MKNFTIAATLTIFTAFVVTVMSSSKGIVTIPNYEHGVALCEGTEDAEMVTQEGEYHMWSKNGVLYVVNYGHINDPEIEDLIYWGEHECAQYTKP